MWWTEISQRNLWCGKPFALFGVPHENKELDLSYTLYVQACLSWRAEGRRWSVHNSPVISQ